MVEVWVLINIGTAVYALVFIKLTDISLYFKVCYFLSILLVLIQSPIFVFLLYLISYHAWLVRSGLSTYKHILMKRDKAKKGKEVKDNKPPQKPVKEKKKWTIFK